MKFRWLSCFKESKRKFLHRHIYPQQFINRLSTYSAVTTAYYMKYQIPVLGKNRK